MPDVFAFVYRARYSICKRMGSRHNNYVGSFFVRRPRARFTTRGAKSHLQCMFTAPMKSAAQIFLLGLMLLSSIEIGVDNLRSLVSFVSPFRVFEFALSLHNLPQGSISNELGINRFALLVHFISFSFLDVLYIRCNITGKSINNI